MLRATWAMAAVCATAWLTGCIATTTHPIMRESSEIGTQAVCCASFRDMPFIALPAAQKRTFQIDGESPVYAFKEGRSRFVAVRLPAGPASMRLRSNVVTAWVEPTTFDPFVTFLDQGFESLGETVPELRNSSDALSRYREAVVRVPARAAYAVLYTKPVVYLGRRLETPPQLMSGAQPMSIPVNAFPIMAGPRGELVLEVLTRN